MMNLKIQFIKNKKIGKKNRGKQLIRLFPKRNFSVFSIFFDCASNYIKLYRIISKIEKIEKIEKRKSKNEKSKKNEKNELIRKKS